MKKVLVVAKTEYLIAITSKAFLLGIVMMPVFMGGAIAVQYFTKDQVDLNDRRVAIVDESGALIEAILQASELRNSEGVFEGEGDERKQMRPKFIVDKIEDVGDERLDISLSDRVRKGDLFAFAIIPQNVFDISQERSIDYYTQTPTYRELSDWLNGIVNGAVKQRQIEELKLTPQHVAAISSTVPLKQYGLVERSEDGTITKPEEGDRVMTFVLPFGGMMLMFMMIMSVAPAMLNNVLEEKMQKISEFLVSSISPFQLMLGKLLGAVGVGLTLSAVYLGAVYCVAVHYEVADAVPLALYGWFIFYLLVALTIFGSVFSAIGASCSVIRDAQSLMMPIMLLVIIPMMCMGPVLQSPSSFFSKAISLFPTATPMLMFARIALPPGPETWEIILGAVICTLFAAACVWAAGRVFRVGVLAQGQAPSFAKLLSWIFTK